MSIRVSSGGGSVAFFDAYPHLYGGAQQITHQLALDLRTLGWSVRVVLPAGGCFLDRLKADQVATSVVAPPGALMVYGGGTVGFRRASALMTLAGYSIRLQRVFHRADVVHLNDSRGVLVAGLGARLARRPTVWHLHSVSRSKVLNRIGRALSDEIVTVSDSALRAMNGLGGHASVERNPLRTGFVQPSRAKAHLPLIVTAGRLHPDKGVDVLLRAMAEVVRDVPLSKLVVIGDAPANDDQYGSQLRELAAGLKLAPCVEFAGWVERPADRWSEAWVYVQPSRPATESHGLALTEAMASGLPVVVTDVPGLSEQVSNEENGLVVPPEDPAALATAIRRLLVDSALAQRLAEAARNSAITSAPDCETYAERWAARYARLSARA